MTTTGDSLACAKVVSILTTHSKDYPDGGNEVEFIRYPDGSVAFSKDMAEHFIYLYPDQLKEALELADASNRAGLAELRAWLVKRIGHFEKQPSGNFISVSGRAAKDMMVAQLSNILIELDRIASTKSASSTAEGERTEK